MAKHQIPKFVRFVKSERDVERTRVPSIGELGEPCDACNRIHTYVGEPCCTDDYPDNPDSTFHPEIAALRHLSKPRNPPKKTDEEGKK